jgi:hypothetical protein
VLGDYDDVGVEVDWKRASARLERLGCDDDDALLWWCYTGEMLLPHVDVIVRLATALFHAGSLSGDEIDALLYGDERWRSDGRDTRG